jgi:hypothetical protein
MQVGMQAAPALQMRWPLESQEQPPLHPQPPRQGAASSGALQLLLGQAVSAAALAARIEANTNRGARMVAGT